MESIEVRRPIVVKAVMTENFRELVLKDTAETLKNHEVMFKQLEDLFEKNKDITATPMAAIEKQMTFERNRLEDIKKEMDARVKDFKSVPDGQEVVYAVVEGIVPVKVGDDLTKVLASAEIVMKDFKVVELRGF